MTAVGRPGWVLAIRQAATGKPSDDAPLVVLQLMAPAEKDCVQPDSILSQRGESLSGASVEPSSLGVTAEGFLGLVKAGGQAAGSFPMRLVNQGVPFPRCGQKQQLPSPRCVRKQQLPADRQPPGPSAHPFREGRLRKGPGFPLAVDLATRTQASSKALGSTDPRRCC